METNFLEFWYAALGTNVGICIETDDPDRCKQRLYAARKASGDPDLDCLAIVQSPTDAGHLWIIHKEIKNASA